MYFCGWKGFNVTRSLNAGPSASFVKMQVSFPWGFIQIMSCFHQSKGYNQNGIQNMHLFMWRDKRKETLPSLTLKENPAALNVKCLYKAPCLLLCFIWEHFIFYLLRGWVWKTPVCVTWEGMRWPGKSFWSVLLILWCGVWGVRDWQWINVVKTTLFLSNGLGRIQASSVIQLITNRVKESLIKLVYHKYLACPLQQVSGMGWHSCQLKSGTTKPTSVVSQTSGILTIHNIWPV